MLFPGDPALRVKGHPLAVAAVTHARERVGPIELVTLGDVPPARVPFYMNACDAVLLTSLHEGSPNVVKEALGCNVPVVSVRVGDTPLLLSGVDGCMLVDRDSEALGVALAEILTGSPRSAGRDALQRLGLDLTSVAREIVAVYERVLSRRAAS